jgi:cytochrome P450
MTEYALHSPEFFTGDPFPVYRELRSNAPVFWYEHDENLKFWAVLRYSDVRYLSSNPQLFTSESGVIIPDVRGGNTAVDANNILFMDPPRHRQLRRIILSGFTPRRIAALESRVREIVLTILDDVSPEGTHEFAEELAAPLPTRMIAELLGCPVEDWEQFRKWSDAAVGGEDPDVDLDPQVAMLELHEYFKSLVAERRKTLRDDLLSVLVAAEVDGQPLSDDLLLTFAWLIMVGGNETTRNLIALGTLALMSHPAEYRKLVEDPVLIPSAVEEMLRWCNPVTHMARHAVDDTELRGQSIKAGDMLVMFYGSANRDEEIFGDDAEEFKVTRSPNSHIAFGYGEHVCLGAWLARLEARVMFEELLQRYPRIELVGAVDRMRATMVPGVKRMPVRLNASV